AAREHHLDKAADAPRGHRTHNDLVAVTVGAPGEPVGDPTVLWSAADFVSDPRPNPDGTALCWLQWDHPDMPWDRTELWAARLVWDAGRPGLRDARRVAGGEAESIAQPAWSPRGVLHLVSDRDDGWWSLYRVADDGVDDAGVPPADAPLEPVVVVPEGELAQPRWVFGQSWYAWAPDGTLVVCARHAGRDRLLAVPADGAGVPGVSSVRWIAEENTAVDGLVGTSAGVACIAASFTAGPGVVELRDPAGAAEVIVVRAPDDVGLDATWWSAPEHIDVPIDDGSVIHALVYPPVNPEVRAPEGALPPLLVQLHGGPTSAARPLWAPAVQYWTSRGWCVADVNYRGSTGYGRRYREALYGRWGEAEAADCIAVARWLVQAGRVDGRHLVIRGSSAGRFTALA
ncbi:MAG TPA: prolyl oligopeptidase family serine peptidase, partial [Acidimicrobiales bacterium]|nr:prolyl oligopeptidase family serine peptidase [Acidimicrobiales bacterium]